MLVKEMSSGHNCNKAIDFLKDMNCFTKFICQSIDKTAWPRPDGFRVRVAAGHVLKMNMTLCKQGCTFQSDYIGYPVNLASRMLDIAKDSERLICHESVRDIIGVKKAEKAGVAFKPLNGLISTPEGVDDEDIKGLWSFEFQ